jgi:hypothetical protein
LTVSWMKSWSLNASGSSTGAEPSQNDVRPIGWMGRTQSFMFRVG